MRSLIVTRESYRVSLLHGSHIVDSLGVDHALAHCYKGAISSFTVLARCLRQHSLSLAEALALCISIVFSTQIHSIVCIRIVVWMHPLLQASPSCHIASWLVFRPALPKIGFYSGHAMLIATTLSLLLLSKCWGPCDIRRKPPPTDTFFHKTH
jgi:hypothetical protein